MGLRFRARLAQRVGLRLAAPLGHGFCEVGKQHREPKPKCNLQSKAELSRVVKGVPRELDRRQNGAHFYHEHDWVLYHRARIQLAK